jgi:hypothetical protein
VKNLILSILAVLMLTPIARASEGGHGGSGGDGYMCPKAHPGEEAWPPYNLRLVDTYGHEELDEIVQDNVGQLMNPFGIRTVARFLNRKMPALAYPHPYKPGVKISFGSLVLLKYFQLYFYHSEFRPLPDIGDDNIWWWSVPRGCKKVQLAIQDIKSGVVRMSDYVPNLPVIDDMFLRLHEVLIALRAQPGLDTTPVRRDVDRLASMARNNRADFVRGLTKDWETSVLIPENTPALVMPKTLRCSLTWRMPRIDAYQPKFALPATFLVTRVKGSGKSTDNNQYQVSLGQAAVTGYETNMLLQATIYSSTKASEINAFETKFEFPRGVTYEAGVYDYVPEIGAYVGSVQASFTNKDISSKSKQMSSHEMYDGAGLICVQAQ